MWPRDELTNLLGIEHPIIQAPMAGSATPALAAAVSNAGGLGSIGCGTMDAAGVTEVANAVRQGTNRPFNLNFFLHREPEFDAEVDARTAVKIEPFLKAAGITEIPETGKAPFGTFDDAKRAALLDARPKVASFHFDVPDAGLVSALKEAGTVVLASATTVAEARMLAEAGIDAVIAQGWEAGGHRGTFETDVEDVGVGTMALVPQIVDAVDLPVIAAGGIADGRGIAAAFALGASGVQMGTAFLSCPEAAISEVHRTAIRNARDEDTRLTRAFSGRPARARNTAYIEGMASVREDLPDFPLMYGFSDPLRAKAAKEEDPEGQFLLYGQSASLNRELPAADLMTRLVEEAREILKK